MDKLVMSFGIASVIFLGIAFLMLLSALKNLFSRKLKVGRLWSNTLIFIVIVLLGVSSLYVMLFLKTFSLYTREDKIGSVYALKSGDSLLMAYKDYNRNRNYIFSLKGNEWMIEGYIMRWKLPLRFLGANSYYKVTGFSGRNIDTGKQGTVYSIAKVGKGWKLFMRNYKKIPFVEAVYGIAAFQYPDKDTFGIYINDTGFIIKK